MRRVSREIALPSNLLTHRAPRRRLPVRKAAKHTAKAVWALLVWALLVLVGFGLARYALATDSCCGPTATSEARLRP
ncbi:MAG: hypothetical protein M3R09_00035 [Actinomycetota bacterium]|nr:hypothetical protein [Actinomycetota bacterium]